MGYAGNLYGCRVELLFHKRLRSEMQFLSLDELKARIEADCREATALLKPLV